jgi:hypothetical protein
MSLYILALLLSGLVVVSITLHYAMVFLDLLPRIGGGQAPVEQEFFKFDYRFVLNLIFLAMSAMLVWLWHRGRDGNHSDHDHGDSVSLTDKVLRTLTGAAILWLVAGLVVPWLIG